MSSTDYLYASLGLAAIVVFPLTIVSCMSCFTARTKKDPARTGTVWLRAAFGTYALSVILFVAYEAVSVAYLHTYYGNDIQFSKSIYYLNTISTLFDSIANILILIALVEFGLGFLLARDADVTETNPALSGHAAALGQQDKENMDQNGNGNGNSSGGGVVVTAPTWHNAVRYVAYAASVLLLVMSFAYFGKALATYVNYFNAMEGYSTRQRTRYSRARAQMTTSALIARKIGAAMCILFFIATLPLFSLGVFVMSRFRGAVQRSSAGLFLASTILFFVRWLWSLIVVAAWTLPLLSPPTETAVVEPILVVWVTFVLLILLYVISTRVHNGLWSKVQPWMQPTGPVIGGPYYPPATYAVPIGQPVNQPINQPVGQPINQPVTQPAYQWNNPASVAQPHVQ